MKKAIINDNKVDVFIVVGVVVVVVIVLVA